MNTRDTSLLEILFPQGQGVSDAAWAKILLNPAVVAVLTGLGVNALDAVKTEIRSSITGLFKMSLLDVLVSGWKKYAEVSDALTKSKQTPKDTVLQSMANHTFKSVQHPYIALYRANTQVGKIEFETTVSLNVEALQLKIQNGEITGILTGACQGSVQLALAGQVLSEAQTGRIALPGAIAVTQPPPEPSEQVAKVQLAAPPDLPEQAASKPAPPPPLSMKSTVAAPVPIQPVPPAPPPPTKTPSRGSGRTILIGLGVIVLLCVCLAVAVLAFLNLRPTPIAQLPPSNPPGLLPPPTTAPFPFSTVAPLVTSGPAQVPTPAPLPPTSAPPTIPTVAPLPPALPPTAAPPTAPPPTAAPPTVALPTPTTAPTLPPPGLYVTAIGMNPAQPTHGQLVNFTVTFLNTGSGDVGVKWRMYLYRADTPNKTNTDSAPVQATFHTGSTPDQPVPMNFKLGSTGNACDYFYARVDTVDNNNNPTGELAGTDGKVFQKDFTVCN